MKWRDIGKNLLEGGVPLLGDILTGNIPGAVQKGATMVAEVLGVAPEPEAVDRALRENPEAVLKLRQAEMKHRESLLDLKRRIRLDELNAEVEHHRSDAAQIESVNQTMRAEAPSHPWSGMWRPVWGFLSAGAFFIAVIGLVLIVGMAVSDGRFEVIGALPGVIGALVALFSIPGAILGVAAWHRGVMQRVQAGEARTVNAGLQEANFGWQPKSPTGRPPGPE